MKAVPAPSLFKRSAPIREGIFEFVDPARLSPEKYQEWQSNQIAEDEWLAAVDLPLDRAGIPSMDLYFARLKNVLVMRILNQLNTREICFLGCGWGTEIVLALDAGLRSDCIYASDLTFQSVKAAGRKLANRNQRAVLFTSDLDDVPLIRSDVPVIIHQALHHIPEMHAPLERMLRDGYENLILVEPLNNWLLRRLENWGLARRVEYSGVKPGRLEVPRLRSLAERHGYALQIESFWQFPEDYYRRLRIVPESVFLAGCGFFTWLTRPVAFGNVAVIWLRKV